MVRKKLYLQSGFLSFSMIDIFGQIFLCFEEFNVLHVVGFFSSIPGLYPLVAIKLASYPQQ